MYPFVFMFGNTEELNGLPVQHTYWTEPAMIELVSNSPPLLSVISPEADSTVEGYICYGPTPLTEATWDVYWMAVARDRQGQGIGSALLKSAEKEISEHQGRLVMIETSSTPLYERTRRFHVGEGYEAICRIPDFYAPGDDKLIMQKRLR